MKVLGHLLKTLFRSFFRVLVTAILSATLAVGVGLLVAYQIGHAWPPRHAIDVIIAAVAVLFAYAASLTVLISESVKALLFTAKEAEKETYTAGNLAERAVKAAEHAEQAEHAHS
ncbi:MAG TPA: hypothetical protein VKQ30_14840 [Ktedonobacterales bacterium]|nr:hypothetical protein [Ktedonobacterales bacterium]